MRVVLDATPLLGQRTGVGRYTDNLLRGLAQLAAGADRPDQADGTGRASGTGGTDWAGGERWELAATAFTWRGLDELATALPPGVRPAARRAPARLLQDAWARSEHPPVEWLTGPADIVHATNFVLPPLRRARGVLTIHDLSYLRTPDTVTGASARYTDLVPRGLRRASAVVTPSRAVADEVISAYHLDPAMVTPTPLGVDEAWFTATKPTPDWLRARRLPAHYLLFIGSPEPRKNLPALLEALRRLHAAKVDPPPLVLVGPAGWGPALDLAGLPPGAVHTTGYLDDDDLRRVVAGAEVLCFPSRYEGFGLPPLEALAAGTPVVAADIPTVREAMGALLDPGTAEPGTADPSAADAATYATHDADARAAREGRGARDTAQGPAPCDASGHTAVRSPTDRERGGRGPVRLVRQADRDTFADDLAEAILELLDSPGDAAAGRAHARTFTWRRTAELTAAVYRRVAESP